MVTVPVMSVIPTMTTTRWRTVWKTVRAMTAGLGELPPAVEA